MVNHKTTATFLALALLAQPLHATREDDGFQPLKTIGIIGGICLGAYAIGSGIKYLCTPSNETLITKGHDLQFRIQSRYDVIMQYCQARGYTLREEDLDYLARAYVGGFIDAFRQERSNAVSELSQARKNLIDRMHKLDHKGERYGSEYRTMERLEISLAQLETSLRKSSESIDMHTAYFELHACEHDICSQYQYISVVDIINRYGSDHVHCAQYLREQVALAGINCCNPYPTISYIENLTDKISKLEKVIHRCTYHYDLLTQATALYTKLSHARSVLLADDRYAFEMQDRERARREQERLRIERERLAAEQRKADAAQRQAYAAECQNREFARQNDILREQNRIERERNERHRYCDRHHCCCNQGAECPIIRIDLVR